MLGAIDVLTHKSKRAPIIMRIIGLEWIWRLFAQPKDRKKRMIRIYNAVIKFTIKVIKWRYIKPFLYRPNVSCLLYKKIDNEYKILLVDRRDELDHWQLPQGGLDRQSISVAAKRELKEELNIDNFKIIKTYKNIHKYKFGTKLSKFGVPAKNVSGFKGQKQSLAIAEYSGKDSDIKINFWEHTDWKWVNKDELIDKIHSVRKK